MRELNWSQKSVLFVTILVLIQNSMHSTESSSREVYKEPDKKRFILSREQFAKDRMQTVQKEVRKLIKDHPEVLSFCMFGSMVKKGTPRIDSDIDGYLFIDASLLGENAAQVGLLETEYFKNQERVSATYLQQERAAVYIAPLREQIKRDLNLDDEHVKHIRSLPVSREIIDTHLEGLLAQAHEEAINQQEMQAWKNSEPTKDASIAEKLAYYERRPKQTIAYISPTLNLYAMFHLAIGDGVKQYRRYLLERLSAEGEMGEVIWKEIIGRTSLMEQGRSSDKPYPKSLSEAVKVYG